jgi:hypothetical protein
MICGAANGGVFSIPRKATQRIEARISGLIRTNFRPSNTHGTKRRTAPAIDPLLAGVINCQRRKRSADFLGQRASFDFHQRQRLLLNAGGHFRRRTVLIAVDGVALSQDHASPFLFSFAERLRFHAEAAFWCSDESDVVQSGRAVLPAGDQNAEVHVMHTDDFSQDAS